MSTLLSTTGPAAATTESTAKELRIALMLPNLQIGGSQQVVQGLARKFCRDGCYPVVGALFQGGPLESELKEQGTAFEVFDLPRRPIRLLPWYLADMWRIWCRLGEFFLRHQINVIQTNNLGTQEFLVAALARHLKIPVVTFNFQNERFFPPDRSTSHVLTRIQRRCYRACRGWVSDYVAVSPETKAAIIRELRLAEDDVTTICNAVDTDKSRREVDGERVRRDLGLEPDAKLLITVATFKEQKGHRYLIDAAVQVTKREPQAHFLFVGDGALRDELERQVEASGLLEHVHFLGSRRDVADLLLASDIFVLPSLYEGLSMALLEAMAAGIPVIATAVAGTTTVVENERLGVLVPPSDSAALATAIIEMLGKSPSQLQAQCDAAHQRVVEEFSLDQQANKYLALYDRLLAAKS